ncbi:cytochrome P450 [Trujillonella endophytica]|uniref:Cytochrome P450 n=1 Tax=Trujillonella endophytica TaxID=673521 RepID=A0A1H8RTN4_9ACTN|nr:cytochrome P450 [Trujillella endophytica]SEO69657.1 Cytochrome P450 [Trujillella endophytica]
MTDLPATTADPAPGALYWDPYDVAIDADPYPVYRRLREEAPLYYNERHDFFAISRADDVDTVVTDPAAYISGRGAFLDFVRAGIEFPPGMFIFQDPPVHTRQRDVLAGVFTPRRVAELAPQIRAYCARSLDPLIGSGRIDFVTDLADQMPMRVIGMLLGIPESDQELVRDTTTGSMHTDAGKPMEVASNEAQGAAHESLYADYITWREKNPSDDLMTQLLNSEVEDESGDRRRLTHEEILTFVGLLAGAGNETSGRLLGWMGKVLGDHPVDRRELVENRALIPAAIEEILRFEPPGHSFARVLSRDVEWYGTTVPKESVVVFLPASANRDERRFPHGDVFDIHRPRTRHFTFGYGIHYCLGAALARLEGQIALDEVLTRFPEWHVDEENARMLSSSVVRGWETLPASIP